MKYSDWKKNVNRYLQSEYGVSVKEVKGIREYYMRGYTPREAGHEAIVKECGF